ncbi:Guanine nucleotide-binding protein alpha-3 subunit [Orobanche minor]
MVSMKSLFPLIMLVVLVTQNQLVIETQAQNTCATALTSLNVCAPFVVAGAATTSPSSDCCEALQSVDHDCLCSTLRIASRMPAQCKLAPLTCEELRLDHASMVYQ